jgi:type VI secretion system protein ImpG
MNREFLSYYNRELQHLRGMAVEFARENPKIAGRLSLDEFECADPYVERLLEGFAYMSARVQFKYDHEFPRFTQSILSTVYPHFLAPTPSMLVAQFQPNLAEQGLAIGMSIARGSALRSIIGKGEKTPCEYRTAHDVTLWPLKISQVDYLTRELSSLELPSHLASRAAIRIRLETGPGMTFSNLKLDRLSFFIRGPDDLPVRIYEQIFAQGCGVVVQPTEKPVAWQHHVDGSHIHRVGFDDDQALLPYGARSFQGYRLMQEYFAFPQRFLFFELTGLKEGIQRCKSQRIDLVVLLNQTSLDLENRVDASNLALFCTPAVNLFPKRLDRIQLSDRFSEHHLMPDRTRPRDFEIYDILEVTGIGERSGDEQPFRPFYASNDLDADTASTNGYYLLNRVPRVQSAEEKERGLRSNYAGSEVFLSLVDAKAAPYRSDLRQLSLNARCTNRDLPLQIPIGRGRTDFTIEGVAPVESVRCVAGPTRPRAAYMEGEIAWRAISHLSLNYLSLIDSPSGQGAAALRDLLKLYADPHDPQVRKQVEGVLSVSSKPVTRRIVTNGPMAFIRGVEVSVTLDEKAFEGTGAFLIGALLECFFSKYVSLNSFAETVIHSKTRGEIVRWPVRLGLRHVL